MEGSRNAVHHGANHRRPYLARVVFHLHSERGKSGASSPRPPFQCCKSVSQPDDHWQSPASPLWALSRRTAFRFNSLFSIAPFHCSFQLGQTGIEVLHFNGPDRVAKDAISGVDTCGVWSVLVGFDGGTKLIPTNTPASRDSNQANRVAEAG
jgi:hypothetical protein